MIDPSLYSLEYSTVDKVAQIIAGLGCGALLAKIDIESAYCLIVQPEDHHQQCCRIAICVWTDPMLPFGVQSVPMIFKTTADALA